MNSLRDMFETMGQVTLFVVCGLAASLPATLMMYLAIERESWLLGMLTFVLFVLTVTLGIYLDERFGG